MKLTLHHINFVSQNVSELDRFYSDILDLTPQQDLSARRVTTGGYPGDVAFRTDGTIQFHLAQKDMEIGFRTGEVVNPVERGHIAFRTDDIASFKKRLEEKGISYSDYGDWAMKGWQQIFFYDPEGNVIEVHQVDEDSEG